MSFLSWLVGGDFNEVISLSEKEGGAVRHEFLMNNFCTALEDFGLKDLGFEGPRFTWTNQWKAYHLVKEHMDRCAHNDDCLEVVRNSWAAADGRNSIQRVVNHLGACSSSLRRWNGNNKWNLQKNIEAKKRELVELDGMSEEIDWKLRNIVKVELEEPLRYEETFWKQRLKVS
ncbi:hypothetical protein LWI28_013324 [Acer negundo]|uniref:Uncharacterized protein n=1 Tax=Acer negundo TaxID=4023 RepID=A0AAD5IIJ0_ACENE|nr:hypothetical protein LWI28_013324 [Acer negundo]